MKIGVLSALNSTPGGQKIYKEIEEGMNLYFVKVYQSIPENKREQVIESLDLLAKALKENQCCKKYIEKD